MKERRIIVGGVKKPTMYPFRLAMGPDSSANSYGNFRRWTQHERVAMVHIYGKTREKAREKIIDRNSQQSVSSDVNLIISFNTPVSSGGYSFLEKNCSRD